MVFAPLLAEDLIVSFGYERLELSGRLELLVFGDPNSTL